MAHITQVNYEEASLISKGLHSEGDDVVQLHSRTRQRVHALHSDWVGDAADSFFEEMESELLPALQRVSGALFLGEEILNKVMKIIHEADEETADLFKNDLGGDFGAGLFGAAVGAAVGGVVAGGDDFGASKFEDALTPDGSNSPSTGGEGTEPPATNTNPTMDMQPPSSTETPPAETPPAETETPGGGGGGGGGGSSSQGLQGDLKGLGTGVGGVVQQSGAGGGPAGMPDHIYEGSSGGTTGGGSAPSGPAGGGGGAQEQSSGGSIAGAAGAAGVVGAAAAGAAKVLKNDNNESG